MSSRQLIWVWSFQVESGLEIQIEEWLAHSLLLKRMFLAVCKTLSLYSFWGGFFICPSPIKHLTRKLKCEDTSMHSVRRLQIIILTWIFWGLLCAMSSFDCFMCTRSFNIPKCTMTSYCYPHFYRWGNGGISG